MVPGQRAEHGADGGDGRGVEVVGGLVEQQQVRLAGREHGQTRAWPARHPTACDGIWSAAFDGRPKEPSSARRSRSAFEHGVAHVGQRACASGRSARAPARSSPPRRSPRARSTPLDGSCTPARQRSSEDFPAPLRPMITMWSPRPAWKVTSREHLVAAVADAQLRHLERDGARAGRRRELELAGPLPLVDLRALRLHPLDPLVERLGLAGPLLGARPHGVGQRREALDLALLQLGGALALGLVGLVLRLELRVVALPLGQPLVRDVQHLGDGLVEQLEVVAHHEEGAGEAGQLVEQPALGRAVEVVGRLVEDHQLGLLEEHPHEVDTAALAARELVDVLEQQLLAEAEAVGQAGHDRLGLVAAVRLELLLQVGEELDVLLGGVVGHGVAGRAEGVVEDVEAPGREDVREPGGLEPEAAGRRGPGAGTRTTRAAGRCPGGAAAVPARPPAPR